MAPKARSEKAQDHIGTSSAPTYKFKDANDILRTLRTRAPDDQEALIEVLTALRNQLSLPSIPLGSTQRVPADDVRILLAQEYLVASPACPQFFQIWDSVYTSSSSHPPATSTRLLVPLLSLLANLLDLLSSQYLYHQYGHAILKALLAPVYSKRLSIYISGGGSSTTDLILVSMKLWVAMAEFAGGREKQKVIEAFGWDNKVIMRLLSMRRRSKTTVQGSLAKPDIRTLTLVFLLSPLSPVSSVSTTMKQTYVSTTPYADALALIWKGMETDSPGVIRYTLERLWEGLWCDKTISRKDKVALFNERALTELIKLYHHSEVLEGEENSAADLIHHFLLAICARPGIGICFQDRGWYPRVIEGGIDGVLDASVTLDQSADVENMTTTNDRGAGPSKGRIYNKVLANVLKMLKVNEDARQQELALRILAACPELVAGFWPTSSLTLEPRLSSRWITNVAFTGSVVSLAVPEQSFVMQQPSINTVTLGAHVMYHPTPPPLSTIMENIIPSVLSSKANFTKILLGGPGAKPMVQHCVALALVKCLDKLERVLRVWRQVEVGLEEPQHRVGGLDEVTSDEESIGQWGLRRQEILREARKRLPDFQVIMACVHHTESLPADPEDAGLRRALLGEVSLKLLGLYRKCLPEVAMEAKFDVGKLLSSLNNGGKAEVDRTGERSATQRLAIVAQLHILGLLQEIDSFALSAKSGSASRSNLYVLLKMYIDTDVLAIRTKLQSAITHSLSQTLVFQANANSSMNSLEPELWLRCMPSTLRMRNSSTPHATLPDGEGEGLVNFLDDCFGRCQKKVYSYMEGMQTLVNGAKVAFPSPLMMVLLEQLKAKLEHKALSPPDTLALITFSRKLVFRLMGHLPDLEFLTAFGREVARIFQDTSNKGLEGSIKDVLMWEVSMLERTLSRAMGADLPRQLSESNVAVQAFITEAQSRKIPSTPADRIAGAFEFVDQLRFFGNKLRTVDVRQAVTIIEAYHPPACQYLIEYLDLSSGLLWDGFDVVSNHAKSATSLPFEWLYIHADLSALSEEEPHAVLVDSLLEELTLVNAKRAIQLVAHLLTPPNASQQTCRALDLIASVLQKAEGAMSSDDHMNLKTYTFGDIKAIHEICTNEDIQSDIKNALSRLINCLHANDAQDSLVVAEIAKFWVASINRSINSRSSSDVSSATKWIQFIDSEPLLDLFDSITDSLSDTPSQSTVSVLREILVSIKRPLRSGDSSFEWKLRSRLPQLLALRPVLSGFYVLEDIVATALESSLPIGHDSHDARHQHIEAGSPDSISNLIERAETHWSHRLDAPPSELDLKSFLHQTSWSPSTVRITSALLYRHTSPDNVFWRWVGTDNCAHRSTHDFAIVLHAILDAHITRGKPIPKLEGDGWLPHFTRLLKATIEPRHPREMRARCSWCMSSLLLLVPAEATQFANCVASELSISPGSAFPAEILTAAARIFQYEQHRTVVSSIVTSALQGLVSLLGDEDHHSEGDQTMIRLIPLVTPDIKVHLVEPLLTVVSKQCLANKHALDLSTALVKVVPLKPVVVNRFLQNILQHPQFFKYSSSSSREAIINLLSTLFHQHPANTCQPTHVEPLVRIYQGSLSVPDQQILAVFRLFEVERTTSMAPLLSSWSSSPDIPSADASEAIRTLDPGRVLRTCLGFPHWRRFEVQEVRALSRHETLLYDPVFLLLLFAQAMSESPPTSALAWVELFRTNIICLVIRTLSSRDEKMREVALMQITALWGSIQNADMQERPHVIYILNLLKDTLDAPSDLPAKRLPSYSTLILLHALRAIFYPSNFIYPLTSSFLLQRPELDTHDIPMLYGMLYSSSDAWKKERGWIIRFLSDGMISTNDWRVLKRRHTWDLLASLYQSSADDRALRNGILEVLANITCNVQATTSLVLKSALLSWIEMQVSSCRNLETIAWIKILENIMVIVDPSKVESATGGAWREAILRCLLTLLDETPLGKLNVLRTIAPAVLRLSLLPGTPLQKLHSLLKASISSLQVVEENTKVHGLERIVVKPASTLHDPPHPSAELFDLDELHGNDDDIRVWGEIVESLWRTGMTLQQPHEAWGALTSRLLVWRSIVGEEGSEVGGWARKEVVANL
ncbi:hypothetical protein PC9H_005640 [Pleurotus ostreatus]|uniref:Uncharacterized protein n=1 Tax=Pleurotus ostreatus TaxID=5322 RepID=A0A8H6ZWT9_PLEOS|nr:uncharacterized protein PC9H_005640 [Pleurotus ostreatus]KAF7433677.1 hypothetical protein PC9H_005640 [Pleurotus ostreatus]